MSAFTSDVPPGQSLFGSGNTHSESSIPGSKASTHKALNEEFSAPDAELILRSCDGVDFAVYKAILRLASPVFDSMLSLPQSTSSNPPPERPVISMSEDAQSLRLLLRFCYPRSYCAEPELKQIAEIKRAATLAAKFDIAFMRHAVEKALIEYGDLRPEIAYAVAWRFEYPEALRRTAFSSLESMLVEEERDVVEFEEVPASSFIALHRSQAAVPRALESLLPPLQSGEAVIGIPYCVVAEFDEPDEDAMEPRCVCEKRPSYFLDGSLKIHISVPSWWWGYVESVVYSMRGADKPSLDDALVTPLSRAYRNAAQCPRCRSYDVHGILERTKGQLRNEIRKRINEIPIYAPFLRKRKHD
ncbi:hypothetical protein PENSPDRAFT_760157 [Peniophora sp. CONT]|nr:hypothetical protein PENSPDRAFT_760157 [Peniophora sp. CONT]